MIWLYYVVHDLAGSATTNWEDVWVMPETHDLAEPSLWLTVETPEFSNIAPDRIKKLGAKPYLIEGTDMLVNVERFTHDELLEYVGIWLRDTGFEDVVLKPGKFENFSNTNDQAKVLQEV